MISRKFPFCYHSIHSFFFSRQLTSGLFSYCFWVRNAFMWNLMFIFFSFFGSKWLGIHFSWLLVFVGSKFASGWMWLLWFYWFDMLTWRLLCWIWCQMHHVSPSSQITRVTLIRLVWFGFYFFSFIVLRKHE